MHDLLENNTVDVLTQHVEEEPIAHLALFDDGVDDLALDESEADVQEVGTHPGTDDYHESVDDHQGREDPEDEKPEPQEDVDLLVDNVQREYAQGVVFLHFARSTKLVERALRHPRKDVDHWVQPVLLVALCERYHFQAEREKGTFKESVHQEHLTCKIKYMHTDSMLLIVLLIPFITERNRRGSKWQHLQQLCATNKVIVSRVIRLQVPSLPPTKPLMIIDMVKSPTCSEMSDVLVSQPVNLSIQNFVYVNTGTYLVHTYVTLASKLILRQSKS